MKLRSGFDPEDRTEVARLYWQAFGGKLGRVLGPEPRALRLIERVARPDHALCAYDGDGTLLGVAGFHTRAGNLVGSSFRDLVAVYGPVGAAWRALCLAALSRRMEDRQFLVDGLFVRPEDRGRGVGTALIEGLAREALRRGYAELRLDVIEENIRARALYERRGFRPVAKVRAGMAGRLFGFRTTTAMVRRVR